MRLPLPADFFAPVRLSSAEVRDLQQVEARLVAGYLASYDADASGVAWKLVGQRAGVKIFNQRPGKKKKRAQPEPEPEPQSRRCRPRAEERELPALRLVGSVDGTLEDVLYGSMWRSGRERAARAHLTGDGVADGTVLCEVETPCSADPFRSLSVKWALKRAPHGGLVVKDRDLCYLSASGVVHSPRTGVKLGYRLRHSVTFPSCPAFQNHSVVRAQIFLCSFFRQLRNGRVEVFHQGTYDVGGGNGIVGLGLPKSIAEKSIVETLLSLEDVRAYALAKKLARAVENTEAERAVASLSSTSVQESLDGERRCGMCLRRLGSALKRRCAACCHWTCSQCSVRQETVPSANATWKKGPVSARCFCKACVARVLHEDATQYAVRDANGGAYEVTGGRWGHDDIPEEDEGEEEEVHVPGRRHSMVSFAADTFGSEVDELSRQRRLMTIATGAPSSTDFGSLSRLSAKQFSVDSDAMNTVNSSPPDHHRRRSATSSAAPAPANGNQTLNRSRSRPRLSMNAPDILLRSDVGKRNWASSTSALSLQSPQRHVDGSPIVNVNRTYRRQRSGSMSPSVHRSSFGSSCSSGGRSDKEVRVRIITPKRSRPAAAYTPYFASAGVAPRRAPDPGPPSIRTVHHQFFRDLHSNQNVSRR